LLIPNNTTPWHIKQGKEKLDYPNKGQIDQMNARLQYIVCTIKLHSQGLLLVLRWN